MTPAMMRRDVKERDRSSVEGAVRGRGGRGGRLLASPAVSLVNDVGAVELTRAVMTAANTHRLLFTSQRQLLVEFVLLQNTQSLISLVNSTLSKQHVFVSPTTCIWSGYTLGAGSETYCLVRFLVDERCTRHTVLRVDNENGRNP